MRKLAGELGVEAMSLYNHVANKGDLVDAMVGVVIGEINLPSAAEDWERSDSKVRDLGPRRAHASPLGVQPDDVAHHDRRRADGATGLHGMAAPATARGRFLGGV